MKIWRLQGLRFVVIGLASNLVLYFLYLLLTTSSIGHKTAMTLLFVIGTVQTFVFNKRWTFSHRGFLSLSFIKYVIVYISAYFINLMALLILVDNFGYPHQAVQGMMILSLALMLFVLQKYWVFRAPSPARQMGNQTVR